MKKLLNKRVVLLLLVLVAVLSFSARVEIGSQRIITQPVKGDLYLAGSTIDVHAKIDGDLVAGAGTVNLYDSITGDVLVVGGTLMLNGWIGDDIRAAGGTVKITQDVRGDVVVAGGDVEVARGVVVYGDLITTGGRTTMDGTIRGKAQLTGGEIGLNGEVDGDLVLKGGECTLNGTVMGKSTLAAEKIHLGSLASLHQDVDYWQGSGQLDFSRAMAQGKATYRPDLGDAFGRTNWYYLGFGSLIFVLLYLGSVILLLFLLEHFFPRLLIRAGENMENEAARSLGYGILYFIGVPAAIVFAFISLIGVPLGLLALCGYIFTLAFGSVITAMVAANWVNERYHRHWSKRGLVGNALGIFVLIKLLSLLPVLGWVFSFLMVGVAFGALILSVTKKPHQENLTMA